MFDQAYDSPCKKDPLSPEAVQHALDDKTGEGFAVLAEHFMPALKAMVSSLSVPEAEKEDLIQEGLVGLYKAVRLYDPSLSSFATFARLCMRSGILDGLRKYRKISENADLAELEDSLPADPQLSPEHVLMGKEEVRLLLQKIDRSLSILERRIFALRLQGKSASEIASLLGKDKKSVENTLYRVRKKLSVSA